MGHGGWMGMRALGLGAAMVALGLVPSGARAATLDQHQDDTGSSFLDIGGPDSITGTYSQAQTFTAGLSGLLEQVQLYAYNHDGSDLTVEIRNVDSSGAPGTEVLATGTISAPVSYPGSWNTVVFASPPKVVAGTQYAIVAYTSGSDEWDWALGGSADPYPAGGIYYALSSPPSTAWSPQPAQYDTAFRTYVGGADLVLSMVGPSSAPTHSTQTYILTLTNSGIETAQNVVLTDYLPYGTQFLAVTSSQGSCTPPGKGGHQVVCQLGDLAVGDTSNSAVTVKITAKPGNLNNVATVTSDTPELDGSNNTASFTTVITK